MGHYVEIKTKRIVLRKDLPENIVSFIKKAMDVNCVDDHDWLPDHKLFSLNRWDRLFYPHQDFEKPYFNRLENGYYELFLNADINYGYEECWEFADWISPYVAGRKKKEYIGWYKGESWENPRTNLYVEREVNKTKGSFK